MNFFDLSSECEDFETSAIFSHSLDDGSLEPKCYNVNFALQ